MSNRVSITHLYNVTDGNPALYLRAFKENLKDNMSVKLVPNGNPVTYQLSVSVSYIDYVPGNKFLDWIDRGSQDLLWFYNKLKKSEILPHNGLDLIKVSGKRNKLS